VAQSDLSSSATPKETLEPQVLLHLGANGHPRCPLLFAHLTLILTNLSFCIPAQSRQHHIRGFGVHNNIQSGTL
jgi:hypothetical protein